MKLFTGTGLSLEPVGDDEPVFMVRAADAETPAILRKAALLYRARHGAETLGRQLEAFANEAFDWQHQEGNAAPPPPADPPKKAPAKRAAPKKRAAKKSTPKKAAARTRAPAKKAAKRA